MENGKIICKKCGASISYDKKFCPNCGGKLIIRADDTEETVKERLAVYEKTTFPLIEYYEKQGKLVTVDGNGHIDDVYERILKVLK